LGVSARRTFELTTIFAAGLFPAGKLWQLIPKGSTGINFQPLAGFQLKDRPNLWAELSPPIWIQFLRPRAIVNGDSVGDSAQGVLGPVVVDLNLPFLGLRGGPAKAAFFQLPAADP